MWGAGSPSAVGEANWYHHFGIQLVKSNAHSANDPAVSAPRSVLQRNPYTYLLGVKNIHNRIVMHCYVSVSESINLESIVSRCQMDQIIVKELVYGLCKGLLYSSEND